MKRKQFVTSLVLGGMAPLTVISGPFTGYPRSDKGFLIKSGEARTDKSFKLRGVNSNIIDVKVSGEDTNGAFAMFEQTSITQGRGTPLHLHHKQDEVFYVVEGEYYFQVGEEKFRARAGDTVFLPMKVPHAWTQVSPKGKMTILFQPAGKMESFFRTVSSLDHDPTTEEMARFFEQNEMIVVGPPLKID